MRRGLKNDFERELEEKMNEVFKSPVAFAIAIFNIEPTPEQAKLLYADGHIILVEGPELSGRTTITFSRALWQSLNRKGQLIAYITKNQKEARRLKLHFKTLQFSAPLLKDRILSYSDDTYTFDTGSRLIITDDLKQAQKKLPDLMILDDAHKNKAIKDLDPKKAKTLILTYNPKEAQLEVKHNIKIELAQISP